MADPASNGNGSNGRGAMVQWASTVLTLVIAIGTMVNNFSRDTSGQLAALEERSQKRNEQANDRIGRTETELKQSVHDLQTDAARVSEKLNEIETQFRAFGDYANMRHERDFNTCRQLWRRVYGEDLPAYEYHPQISQKR